MKANLHQTRSNWTTGQSSWQHLPHCTWYTCFLFHFKSCQSGQTTYSHLSTVTETIEIWFDERSKYLFEEQHFVTTNNNNLIFNSASQVRFTQHENSLIGWKCVGDKNTERPNNRPQNRGFPDMNFSCKRYKVHRDNPYLRNADVYYIITYIHARHSHLFK